MSTLRALRILIAKDLRSEWHSKEVLSSTVFFAVITMTVINFSFEPGQFEVENVGAGILWTSFLFASLLGMNRLFQAENERGGLEGLMLCPVDRTTLYLAKCGTLFVLLTVTYRGIVYFPSWSSYHILDMDLRMHVTAPQQPGGPQ